MKFFTRILLLFFVFSVSAFSVKASVVAGFTASPTAGCSPLVVYFTNTSTGAASYKWDFGNGAPPSYLTDPSSSYTTPGTYTVTLTASDGKGGSSVYTMTITVYPPPVVSFSASDTAVCPGTPITFTSTSTGGVPGPMTYMWAFGDGSTGTGASPSHTYSSSGYYNVTLTVTNSKGCVASVTLYAYIHVFTPAAIGFSAATTYFCKPPGHAVFTNTTTGTGPFTYKWEFGDGGTSTAVSPTHDYAAIGTYNVTLIVTDGDGCTDSVTYPAYITVSSITASFTYPDTVCINSGVTFKNTSTAHTSSNWTYGDGTTGTTDDGYDVYTVAGTYIVTLIVSDGTCLDTISHKIVVLPGPTISFTQNPLQPCPPPVGITFTGAVSGTATVVWDFGDGTGGSGATITHFYSAPGVYTITMTATNSKTGCVSVASRKDTLYDMELGINAKPNTGCVPLTVYFTNTEITNEPDPRAPHAYPYPVATYSWTFGDGGTSGISAPSHTYTAEGTYEAYLTIVTSNGCTFTDSIQILVGAPPIVTVVAVPTHLCYNKIDSFYITVIKGPVDNYFWTWGDGGTSWSDSSHYNTHFWEVPGVFTVTVVPYYHGCPGPPYVIPTPITVDSPKAQLDYAVFCSPAKRVAFTDLSIGDNTRLWIFGDGTTDTAKNPVHDYPAAITYYVTLIAYNKASGCTDTTWLTLDLTRPTGLDFVASKPAICEDGIDTFTAVVTGGTASKYFWSSAGKSSDSTWSIYIDTFHVRGLETVRLVIDDQNGCLDTVTKVNFLPVAQPLVNFTAVPPSGCWPLAVTFTDKSSDVGGGVTLSKYAWTFGDGGSISGSAPVVTHTFTLGGTFSTEEVVTDNVGCIDSATLPLVTVYRPVASFAASNTYPCSGDAVTFTNTSTGGISSYWMFGDGTTSSATSPTHTYPAPGFYTVTLVVTDAHGCSDTATYKSYIYVSAPVASFTMSDSFAVCPPLAVNFINTSTGAIGYGWTLGDGSSSSLTNPSDLYITTGTYTIILTAVNAYGCVATATGHVTIFGSTGSFSYSPFTGCSPLTVHFSAVTSGVPSIIWDFADGNTSAVAYSDTISHTYTLPGWYLPKLILSDLTGCEASSIGSDTIKVDAVIPGFITIPNPVCEMDTVNFEDTSSSYFSTITSQLWTFSNGDTSTLTTPQYFYDTLGTYPVNLTVTDGWGCTATTTENVVIFPPAQITASPDTTICVGDNATLTGYGGVSYTWSPPGTVSCTNCNPTFANPSVVTTYTVTGTDHNGCINSDTVSVFLKTKTISIAHGDTAVCQGVPVPLYDSGATKYTWIPATGLSSAYIADPWATPQFSTVYTVIAQLASCIADTNYVTVIVHPLPTVDAGPDQTLVEGSTAQLHASGTNINSYSWGDPGTLSCDSCASPVASMSVTTVYQVTVATDFGCTASDSVKIYLFCDQSQIFIPNTFTPNGDGQNDVFYPRGKGISVIKSFRIYNRWGQLLFERSDININDASNAWDGSYMGGSPRPDVYVYILDATCETGAPINIKGDVTIIK